ncbi:hypothetical protein RDABS01_032065 [Bienertia sinuspersici]
MPMDQVKHIYVAPVFKKGCWPFKYLIASINHKKLSLSECDELVERMVNRVRIWQSRNLPFASRLQLVNSVLTSVCTYWMQIMVLPKSVIDQINKVCRYFLRQGNAMGGRNGTVKLEKVRGLTKYGGLRVRDLNVLNVVAIHKIIRHISE